MPAAGRVDNKYLIELGDNNLEFNSYKHRVNVRIKFFIDERIKLIEQSYRENKRTPK